MSTDGAKRTMPVPPPKPKFPTPPPKPAGEAANVAKASASTLNGDHSPSQTAGMGRGGHVLPPQPLLAHRRVVSASPTPESSTKPASSPSPGPKTTGPPPKVAPKPPGRPRSGAHQPTNPYETPKTGETNGDGSLERLTLSPTQMKALADEYSVSANELSSLQLLFIEMDTDNDGVVSMADLLRYKYGSRKVVVPDEAKDEAKESPNSSRPASGMMPSASAPHLSIQVKEFSTEDNSSDGEEDRAARDEIGDILKGMDLSVSSSEEAPQVPQPGSTAQVDAPKQGFSFRHIDFNSLPQESGEDSGNDDDLLADWDGPADGQSDDDAKSSKSKGSSKGGFGGLKRKISSKASMLAKKIGK